MKKYLRRLTQMSLLKEKWVQIGISIVILGVFFFFVSLSNVYTETYNIERFGTAKETIRSPLSIENKKETERQIRDAVQAVEDRYNVSGEITDERIGFVNEIFEAVDKMEEAETDNDEKEDNSDLSDKEKVQNLKQILTPEITQALTDEELMELIQSSDHDRSLGKELVTTSLYDVMNAGVTSESIQADLQDIRQNLRYSSLDNPLKNTLVSISEFAVVQNSFYDAEKTVEAQKQASSNVEPVMIRAGEVIVTEGQTITNEIYEELQLVGLLNNDRNIYPLIGLGILVTLIGGVIAYEMNILYKKREMDTGKLLSIIAISIIMAGLMKLASFFTTSANPLFFIVPAAMGAMLLKILLNDRFAVAMAGLYAVLAGILFNSEIPGALNMEAGIYILFSQLAGVVFLGNVKDRMAILKAGLGITSVHLLSVLLFLFFSFEKYTVTEIFMHSGAGVIAAFMSSVLTIGLLPFFETGLGILSDTKLLTLSNPNHPLLRKILTEAPGTYHHSVMVANISESACEAVGANGLLARVAAYYHDLGKTIRPHYFIENQMGSKNPHDMLHPNESADIIINHPYDGAGLLKRHKLPKEIVDVAEQHHGTTLLKYFYYKAKEQNKYTKEKDFRYPGPKPQTKEAAIICICDSVEAAVRSLKEPTTDKIEEIVQSIIDDRLMDGQLSDCPLTFNELDKIKVAVCETLNGIFHSRIQYPDNREVKEAN
ncbi:HD family phosphohydrolase [Sediminibacillus massiliensis]|uniref:HD family phosphohydrolase n=1 Tax=Sediminibacillus massiliensis TaxID=1926277 RepID=UPI0009888597|nr:HD family phosphohydrolase [Sediminibacillus massiliensis]